MMANDDNRSSPSVTKQKSVEETISYTYWTNGETSASSRPVPPPKKLTIEEAAAQAEADRRKHAEGTSAWNHAGTFEEKNLTQWATEWLKENLVGLKQGSLSVTEVSETAGDANIWLVRGKKRCGFDFTITLKWKADIQLTGLQLQHITGTCKVLNASSDDLDDLSLESEVVGKRSEAAAEEAAAMELVPKLTAAIKDKLEAFLVELRAR